MENINESNFTKSLGTPNKTIFTKVVKEENYPKILEFDWKNKWLKGEEYAYMLKNIEEYCQKFNLIKLPKKTHPDSIYSEPQNGMIYFVEGNSVGSDFGFPRVEIKKRYRWKKMNFTTDLPKKRPFVTYIVASAVKCEKFFPNSKNEGPSFRMHAVILNRSGTNIQKYKNSNASPASKEVRYEEGSSNAKMDESDLESSISEESEGESQLLRQVLENDKSDRRPGREYILCHIRKIDSNYKASSRRKTMDDGDSLILNDMKKKKKSKGPNSAILNGISSPSLGPALGKPSCQFSLVGGLTSSGPGLNTIISTVGSSSVSQNLFTTNIIGNTSSTPPSNVSLILNSLNAGNMNSTPAGFGASMMNDAANIGSDNSVGDNERDNASFINMPGSSGNQKQATKIIKEPLANDEDQVRFSKVSLNMIQYSMWIKAIDGNYSNLVNKWVGKDGAATSEPEEEDEEREKAKEDEGENGSVNKVRLIEEILNNELQSGQDELNYSKIFNLLNS